MWTDVDLTDRAGLGCPRAGRGNCDAVDQCHLAAHIRRGEIGRGARSDMDERTVQATGPGWLREGMGDAGNLRVAHIEARGAGQADVGIVMDQPGAETAGLQAPLQVLEAFELRLGSRQLDPASEL